MIPNSLLPRSNAQYQHKITLTMATDQMTNKIEAHKTGLDNTFAENRGETITIIKSLSDEMEKCLEKKNVAEKIS